MKLFKNKMLLLLLGLLITGVILIISAMALYKNLETFPPNQNIEKSQADLEVLTHYLRISDQSEVNEAHKVTAEFVNQGEIHVLTQFRIENRSSHRYQIRLRKVGLIEDSILVDQTKFHLEVGGNKQPLSRENFGKDLLNSDLTVSIGPGKKWQDLYFTVKTNKNLPNKYQDTKFSMYFTFDFVDLEPDAPRNAGTPEWRRRVQFITFFAIIIFATIGSALWISHKKQILASQPDEPTEILEKEEEE